MFSKSELGKEGMMKITWQSSMPIKQTSAHNCFTTQIEESNLLVKWGMAWTLGSSDGQ
jgi:hypothetical protein